MSSHPILDVLRGEYTHPHRTVRLAIHADEWGDIIEERCTTCGMTWTRAR